MKQQWKKILGGLIGIVLAALGYQQISGDGEAGRHGGTPPPAVSSPAPDLPARTGPAAVSEKDSPAPATSSGASSSNAPSESATTPPADPLPTVDSSGPKSVLVRTSEGEFDIGPTLYRIEKKIPHPHRNDGSVFQNRERRLPIHPRGYYREYVHPTPGVRGPGARRVVIGKNGEVYFTVDHYESFVRVEVP